MASFHFIPAVMPGRAQTHKPGRVSGDLDRTKTFHVKHFGTIGAKKLQGVRQRSSFNLVRSINFSDQFQKRGGGASMA